eukprot:7067309-Prymnesium_polylepis.1
MLLRGEIALSHSHSHPRNIFLKLLAVTTPLPSASKRETISCSSLSSASSRCLPSRCSTFHCGALCVHHSTYWCLPMRPSIQSTTLAACWLRMKSTVGMGFQHVMRARASRKPT